MTANPGPLGYEIMAMRKACETQPYQRADCPICAWPLQKATDGITFCKFCGWQDKSAIMRNTPKP